MRKPLGFPGVDPTPPKAETRSHEGGSPLVRETDIEVEYCALDGEDRVVESAQIILIITVPEVCKRI